MAMRPTIPVKPTSNVGELLEGMSKTGFQGRRLGESVDIWSRMIQDRECTIFLGLSGAMIPAGMKECLISLVENHYIDVLVSTGANIFHDLCEHFGVRHYLGHHHVDDGDLFSRGIDRIYDVFAYEEEFRSVDQRIADFAAGIAPFKGSSREFIRLAGEWAIRECADGRSLISACVRNNVPVFIPALCDSSIGIGLVMARRNGISVDVDQISDADEITRMVEGSPSTGVVYIGGGVPKNFIQQTQVIASIHDSDLGGHAYAIQYTTDAPHWGGLSGCTFEEAISWGKESVSSPRTQCFCDATIALPLVTSALHAKGLKRKGKDAVSLCLPE
ncbi:MAG TPA: deoxyhypusine synthase [Methanoregulaceae archaeon]|jgi:deoxyhypusine synthase|nr:deoxyhypusine synthase [Methanoregulaceae archaeon]MDD5047342.1 deoxyhypusine synthase [Methanoregulaceae archaeon]MDD5684182.1 deoxyhypusine synthase [Methanoregulaceae archaeon]HOP67601.1 deoxyhypusine synthase [Methanoregulaceae archaeon]HPJ74454.1 deoxyhypusine synthase [Methanoregulaceae archaeon]